MKIIKKIINSIKKIGIKGTIIKIVNRKKQIEEQLKREEQYKIWMKNNNPSFEILEQQRKTRFEYEPKISILVPMYNTPYNFFKELIECLINQTYSNWELCLADGSENQDEKLQEIIQSDKRIKYKFLKENKGIAGNTNECIKMATGEYIALFDHDDLLPQNSLFEIVKAVNENPNIEFIYTDEDKISMKDGQRFDPHFKPDFSIDFLRANNYICHFSVFKKELMDKLEGERSEYDGAQDFDLILRMSEIVKPKNILHIPKILYHWRAHPNSTAQSDFDAKPYAFEAGIKAIEDHLKRMNLPAVVENGESLGTYRIHYKIKGNQRVSIIIRNAGEKKELKRCIKSISRRTDYNNYEIMYVQSSNIKELNKSIQNCTGEYVILLDSTVKIISNNWIEEMLGFAQRNDVGAVGVRIYYPNNRIKHAGIILGGDKIGFELFRGLKRYVHGYFAREGTIQNFSAVSEDCMMFKKNDYDEIGFFDEKMENVSNIDFCLKLRDNNKLIVYNPFVEVVNYNIKHKEYYQTKDLYIKKFLEQWENYYKICDPYYNRNFSLNSYNYNIEIKNKIKDNNVNT
ncbi:MAG: glycosyltransferase [Clostridia bacterium]|nr:glycosyltransferase [Clostridia bacterium]MBR3255739.1 glycosyltransferase [Clostridia bacterium]